MTKTPQAPALEVFADRISAAAKVITAFCASTGHPHPSFDDTQLNGLDTLPSSAPAEVQEARQAILESAYRLQQLIIEPNQYLARLAVYVSV
jgi:6-hydroxytryprostatin B O-methyltransferase